MTIGVTIAPPGESSQAFSPWSRGPFDGQRPGSAECTPALGLGPSVSKETILGRRSRNSAHLTAATIFPTGTPPWRKELLSDLLVDKALGK